MWDPSSYALTTPIPGDDEVTLWQATRRRDSAPVLVKTHAGEFPNPRVSRRLLGEFGLGTRIQNAHVLRYVDLVEEGERVAIVQEHFDGVPLATAIPPGGFQLPEFINAAIQLAEGLRAIHAQRLVHKDVTPRAVLYQPRTGTLKYFDLGLAEQLTATAGVHGAIQGSLEYIAPEQTGRVTRPIDYRSDLYSLGATLYHLLLGTPPFAAADPLELVHSHLAKLPAAPSTVRSTVPEVVSAIILKLLAKLPEERYQSAAGLIADLTACRGRLADGAPLEPFPLGNHDVSEMFHLPERLYGREHDLERLQAALARVSSGSAELLLVSGYSGSGKSALVERLRTPVTERHGFFLVGKFEQLSRGVPYGAVRQAFRGLVQRLLTEADERVRTWRESLLEALGDQAQVIIDIIPDVERLLGPQPPVEPLGPVETQYRFTRLFGQFVRVFARPEHPLVVFLDDWQWADEASLNLIESLLASPDLRSLWLIGAYRDNELHDAHPAAMLIGKLRARQFPLTEIAVGPLSVDDIALLLRDAFRIDPERGRALTSELHRRTDGNPFFLRASLRDLYDARVLTLSPVGEWQWDPERLSHAVPAENVVSLLAARITRLPEDTQSLLQVAACLGSAFSSETLVRATGLDEPQLLERLGPAIEANAIVRDESTLRFLHDRVQEAAYSLVPRERRHALQLTVGRRLLAALEDGDPEELLVQAVQHLNAGRALMGDAQERKRLARLNLRAGRLARRSTAYAAAAQHAAVGMELVGGDGWRTDYELTLDLYELRAESEYLAGNFDTAEGLYPEALAAARADLDRIRILNVQKDQYELQGRYLDAIAVLRRGLALVGITIPDDEASLESALREELRQMPANLAGRRIADLVDAPPIEDPLRIATLRMLMGLWPSCYVAGLQPLLAVVSVKIANFSLQYGNCEISSAAYVNYSFVAGFITGNYEEAYEYGKVGMTLADRYSERSVRSWCCFLFGCGTLIWRAPLREGRPYLERAVEFGIESGNIASASYAASYIVTDSFMRGLHLDDVRRLYERYFPFLQRSNPAIHLFGELGTQSLRELVGLHRLDDAAFLRTYGGAPFFMAVYRFGKLMAAYLFDDIEQGLAIAEEAIETSTRLLAGTFKAPETLFYAALLSARALDDAADDARRHVLRARVEMLRERLRSLVAHCPQNFAHKARLLDAEAARVNGRLDEAAVAYEEAAGLAAEHGFTQDEALAYELAARFWLARGARRLAAASLADAIATYERWGASRKVRWLEQRFPDLVQRRRLAAGAVPSRSARYDGEPLDLRSVTKASQAISSEMDFDRLLARLMRIVSENAGARRAALFLRQGDELVMAASADIGADQVVVPDRRPLAEANVPVAIVQYTSRLGEMVVLHDAAREGPFMHDPYVAAQGLRSVLCLPVRHKDVTTGIFYLENELNSGVFTSDRTTVLELLLGQVAISLENSRLYTELLGSRARAEEAREQAESANRAKDEFLAMLGHELRNPLAPIMTACELMRLKAPDQFRREREIIERQLRHVTRLVDDLLDVSRIARGKVELKPEPIGVADVIARAVEVVEPLFEQRRIRLFTDVVSGLRVNGDPVRLRQVIANLLNNAAKFSAMDARVWLSCTLDDDKVVISVRDEGVGISSDLISRIFDVFVQGPQGSDRSAGGLGLGLAIARSLVEMHGGTIGASSQGLGHGARFDVRLPRYVGTEAEVPRAPQPPLSRTSRRVMVVDDNRDAAQLLAEALKTLGYSVTVAYDAAEALDTLSRETPDVALLDIGLPVMDGYELARRVRVMPSTGAMTLIAVTGYGTADDRQRAISAGFDAHLTKPIDVAKLQETLDATKHRAKE